MDGADRLVGSGCDFNPLTVPVLVGLALLNVNAHVVIRKDTELLVQAKLSQAVVPAVYKVLIKHTHTQHPMCHGRRRGAETTDHGFEHPKLKGLFLVDGGGKLPLHRTRHR